MINLLLSILKPTSKITFYQVEFEVGYDDIARKEFLLDDASAELSAIIADYVSDK